MSDGSRSRLLPTFASRGVMAVLGLAGALVMGQGFMSQAMPKADALAPVASSAFNGALQATMMQMDSAMCITPSGDADRDFARSMIPHHEGAVAMAKLELQYGKDVRLRRLAQGMVVEQAQEIALMQRILADSNTPKTILNSDGDNTPWR